MGIAVEHQWAPLGVLWQQLLLPRRLARGDIDLFWSPLLTLPWRLPVPGVVTIHDLAVLHYPETLTFRVRWSLLPFLAHSVDRAARIVAVSYAAAADLELAFPAALGKVRVIENGVAADFEPAAAAEIVRTRERLGATNGYFVALGTLEPRKNLGLLLDAWELLRRNRPEAALPLILVGPDGWKNRALKSRLARLEGQGVRHLGRIPRSELIAVLQGARALVYPSLYEGFGLPVAEAMACGVPVLVSDRSSLPEVAGDAGLLFDPTDAEGLAAALARIATDSDLARALGARGRELSRRFSWARAATQLAAVFREAVAGNAA